MTEDKVPQDRREVWLNVALAVARDGLPEPMECTLYADHAPPSVWLRFDTDGQAQLWAEHLGLAAGPGYLGERVGMRDGWRWYVRPCCTATGTVEPSALADEVAAAIVGEAP